MKTPSCPNKKCNSHQGEENQNVVTHGFYRTRAGSRRRYRCRVCYKTFSSTKSTPYFRLQYPRSTFDEVAVMSVEGVNKSAISRVKSPAWNMVHRWLERAGESCRNYSNKTLKGFEIKELQADELCTFVGNKKKATWIFTAMEVWSRLWPATVVGRRSYWNTFELLGQVQKKSKGNKRPLIVTDGFEFYEKAINKIFNVGCLYAQVIKTRRNNRIIKVERREIIGTETQFEEALHESEDSNTLNTSFIERLNLTIRQAISYLTRRTTCHARRQEQLENQLEIVRCYYNFLRPVVPVYS